MYIFYTDSSKLFRIKMTQDGVPVDIRNNTLNLVLRERQTKTSQTFEADVTTQGEQGYGIFECQFSLPPGICDMEIDYIVDGKTYVVKTDTWKCNRRIA